MSTSFPITGGRASSQAFSCATHEDARPPNALYSNDNNAPVLKLPFRELGGLRDRILHESVGIN